MMHCMFITTYAVCWNYMQILSVARCMYNSRACSGPYCTHKEFVVLIKDTEIWSPII